MAAIFRAVYSVSWRRGPMQTPSAYLACKARLARVRLWLQQRRFAVFTACAVRASNLVKELTTRNVTHEWHTSELAHACKLRTRTYRDDTRWCEIRTLARATWYATVWKWTLVCTMRYALVWKWMFACTHTICFGVQNVCLHMLYDMIWCDRQAVGNSCTGVETNPNRQKL